jgi:hypothetical protein
MLVWFPGSAPDLPRSGETLGGYDTEPCVRACYRCHMAFDGRREATSRCLSAGSQHADHHTKGDVPHRVITGYPKGGLEALDRTSLLLLPLLSHLVLTTSLLFVLFTLLFLSRLKSVFWSY